MVARIKRTQSLSRSLNYNEKKVQTGAAECIHAANYPKDLEALNFYDKLHRLEHQAALNERIKANSVHISLNFHESDQFNKEKLCAIAETYMQGIGFENQPYLVYQHHDAAHPHIHIVSTNIQRDGSKIEMQNIGRNQSEKARKNIEEKFKLVKAEGRKLQQDSELKIAPRKVHYGKSLTKRAIANVLEEVITNYKYASLPELNAILNLYNVIADRGNIDSKMYERKGLMFSVLDEKGNKVGVPIKASNFYNKPTLKNLEKKFAENERQKQPYARKLQARINWVLMKKEMSFSRFIQGLSMEGIKVVARQSSDGNIYGLTYIDFKNKCVFNGSDLGKEFSAKAVLDQLGLAPTLHQEKEGQKIKDSTIDSNLINQLGKHINEYNTAKDHKEDLSSIINLLLKPEQNNTYTPHELLKKKRKRKRNKLKW